MFNLNTLLPNLIYILPAVIIALSLHEFAHAFVSYKLGDVSQKERGRMSLNPLKHLDPIGTISLIFFGFGWAKPVQVDPYFYRNKKEGMMWTSLAGPFMNFIVAFICVILYSLLLRFAPVWTVTSVIGDYIFQLLIITARINIGLGIFNLIPIPPLDGSKILTGILKEETYFKLMQYENYFMIAIIFLLASGTLNVPLMQARETIFELFNNIVFPLLGLR
ncbi:site-2 protease family protein [Amedibacillus sp. YH-ame10]